MVKRDVFFAEAESLYINEYMSLKDIASKLKLNEKTVRAWRKLGNWEAKRNQYLKSKSSFHEELYAFSRKLMSSIIDDLDKNEKVDSGRLYTFARLLPLITKMKEYEDIIVKSDDKDTNKGLTSDIVKMIEKEVLGIQNNRGDNKC